MVSCHDLIIFPTNAYIGTDRRSKNLAISFTRLERTDLKTQNKRTKNKLR